MTSRDDLECQSGPLHVHELSDASVKKVLVSNTRGCNTVTRGVAEHSSATEIVWNSVSQTGSPLNEKSLFNYLFVDNLKQRMNAKH